MSAGVVEFLFLRYCLLVRYPPTILSHFHFNYFSMYYYIVKGRGTNSKRENIRNIIPVTQLCGQGRGTRKAFRLRRPDKEMDFSGILTQLEFHRLLGHLRSVFLFSYFSIRICCPPKTDRFLGGIMYVGMHEGEE